jgi:hypothetical protein
LPDQRQILTDRLIARLPLASLKQYKVRDRELPGFFVLVGKRKKSFMVQGEFWRDGTREFAAQVKLGEFGDISTREARSKQRMLSGQLREASGQATKQPSSLDLSPCGKHGSAIATLT